MFHWFGGLLLENRQDIDVGLIAKHLVELKILLFIVNPKQERTTH